MSAARDAVKARERDEVVAHRQEQLDGGLLNDDRDPPAHLERRGDDVVAEDAWRRRDVGRASVVRMRSSVVLPAPFGPSRPKIAPRATSKVRPSSARTTGCRAAGVQLDEITDRDGRFGHGAL